MAASAPTALTIAPYDESWPGLFEAEAERVRAALGDELVEIAHVGSTAVPGLAAKPVIDMLAGTRAHGLSDDGIAALRRLRYLPRTREPAGRLYLRKGRPRSHYLHVTPWGGPEWCDKIAFRDLLLREPDLAAEYAAVKRELASEAPDNRGAYSERKDAFIHRAMREAGLR